MEGVGLRPLAADSLEPAFAGAGVLPQATAARVSVAKLISVQTARGPWSLLEELASAPAGRRLEQEPALPPPQQALPQRQAAAAAGSSLTVDTIQRYVQKAARELLGEQLDDGDSFAASGLDSLSAVELASSLGRSLGLELPGTLVFDYPSVSAMAQHIHGLLAPAQTAGGSAAGALVPAAPAALVTASNAAPAGSMLISLAVAARLPTGYAARGGESVLGGADCISLVPFGRWDLEALRVSSCAGTAAAARPSKGHSCVAACQFNAAIWAPAS